MTGQCQRRLGGSVSGVTCRLGTLGCYVDHEAHDLGLALMSVPGYEPEIDMVDIEGRRVSFVVRGMVHFADHSEAVPLSHFVPDLKRAASRGVLLEQLRDLGGHQDLSVVHTGNHDGQWWCEVQTPWPDKDGCDVYGAEPGATPLLAEIAALISTARHFLRR